ncbi:phospholipid-transporting ATPase ABCA3-like [Haemaphysalis longicornis]
MAELNTPRFLISIFLGILIDAADERVRSRWVLWAQQMHVLLWKNVYLKRLCRHYPAMLFEVVLMIVMLLGIQEETVVREPLIRRGNTVYPPVRPRVFWNTDPDMVKIHEVYYYAGDNAYLHMLTRKAFADLGVSKVIRLASKKEVLPTSRTVANQSSPVRSLVMEYWTNGDGDNLSVDVTFYTGRLPFDVQVQYPHRLIAQPEGPAREERFPEMNTLLPIVAALQQRHLRQQAVLHNYTHPVEPVTLRRFPYPAYIEHHDTKNYALVLTRFCVGMLVPFALFVAILTEEKASGMKEMLRLVGLNDWVFWVNHYLSGFFMHTVISTLMMLFVSVKRNHEGHPFIEYSDPSLIFFIMMCFCSSCLMHGTLLSLFFATPASAVAGSLLYWTFCCLMPFLALEQIDGQGYHYIQSKHKLLTAVFPGMSLHWSFRVLERFEKFVDGGANWSNFFDSNATPDNVTLAEILLVGILTDCCIITSVWYIDNVFPKGPGIPKPYIYPFKVSYWIPSMTVTSGPAPLGKEGINFESEPKDQSVAIEVVRANKDYDGVVAVQDLSLRVFENQITVLLGHNGAGKTTLLNMICGFVDFSSGVITIGGYDIKNCTREARESIGYCPQHNILFDDLTVEEHVMFFALMKGIKRDSVRNGVVTLLNDVRLMQCRHMMAVDLSLGEQRRLCIAIAVLGTPKVIIMDEPTANMDPDGRREIWELLLDIRRSSTIFLTTQHLDEADILADRTVVMANGRIRCIGSPTFLKQRFGTGYHMRVNKMSGCKVARIETVLRKFAPKVTLSSDSDNEAIFVLGEIVATRKIIAMFKALESKGKDLGIESVGLTVTSLEDVLILVGEDQHVHDGRKRPGPEGDELRGMENRLSTVRMMTNATGGEPTLAGVIRAMVVKRAVHVWREKRMPLFSWLMPVVLLSALFILENVAIKGSGHDVERTGDTLEYSFTEVFVSANGFLQADTQDSFLSTHLNPMLNEGDFNIERPDAGTDIVTSLLGKAAASLRDYVFHFHFGVQMTKKTGH